MLYHIFYPLATNIKLFNIFKYLTFRTIYAMITALIVCFVLGPWVIRKLESLQARQVIRSDGPESHLQKQGTPTMGGVIILAAIVIPTLLWADLTNQYIWITLFITIGYGIIGFIDDYKKVVEKNTKGLSARQKMFWQVLMAGSVAVFLFLKPGFSEQLYFPLFKNFHLDLWIWFIPFATLVIVGGIFVIEALSVIFQVGSYKYRGKRMFRMAPIHHHFELKGVAEPKIIVRFWIISILLALVAISTLKMR